MPVKKNPCTVDGIHYKSESEAANALGIYVGILKNRLGSSNFPNYTSKHHPKVKRRKKIPFISCTIKGVQYASVGEAARKLGKSPNLIFYRLRFFNFPDYVSAHIAKIKQPTKPKPPRYEVNGKKYRSLQEISDVEGLTGEGIRQRINNPKYSGYQRL